MIMFLKRYKWILLFLSATALILIILPVVFKKETRRADKLDSVFAGKVVLSIVNDAFALVESRMGAKFNTKPEVVLVSNEEFVKIRWIRCWTMLRFESGNLAENEIKKRARRYAYRFPKWMLAEYSSKEHRICLLIERIRLWFDYLEYIEYVKTRVLRMLIVHEMIHAYDEDRFKRVSQSRSILERPKWEIYDALLEGHAQFETMHIMKDIGDLSLFSRWEERSKKPDSGQAFAYYHGRLFFSALSKRGHPNFVGEVFSNPPKTKEEIINPKKYRLVK